MHQVRSPDHRPAKIWNADLIGPETILISWENGPVFVAQPEAGIPISRYHARQHRLG